MADVTDIRSIVLRAGVLAAGSLTAILVSGGSSTQNATQWSSIRERAVSLAQEVDAAQTKLSAQTPSAEAYEATLASDHFTVAYLSLTRAAASPDTRIRALALRQVLLATNSIFVVARGVGESYTINKFNAGTGEFEYRQGNTAPTTGRLTGVTMSLPQVRVQYIGVCAASIEFGQDLNGKGTATCEGGPPAPVTLSFK